MVKPRKRRGFSLIELMAVVSIAAVLSAISIPTYRYYIDRARSAEAMLQVETIAYLEEVRVLELGAPIACPPNPAQRPGAKPLPFARLPEWQDLGLSIETPVYFQYRVELLEEGQFRVTAEGNPRGTPETMRFTLESQDLSLRREWLEASSP